MLKGPNLSVCMTVFFQFMETMQKETTVLKFFQSTKTTTKVTMFKRTPPIHRYFEIIRQD
jgi:hypothetical protein